MTNGHSRDHALIPVDCKWYLIRKGVSADGIKLKILRWGDYPRLPGPVLNPMTSVFKREAKEGFTRSEEEVM